MSTRHNPKRRSGRPQNMEDETLNQIAKEVLNLNINCIINYIWVLSLSIEHIAKEVTYNLLNCCLKNSAFSFGYN